MITQAPNKIVLGGLKTVFLAGSIETKKEAGDDHRTDGLDR